MGLFPSPTLRKNGWGLLPSVAVPTFFLYGVIEIKPLRGFFGTMRIIIFFCFVVNHLISHLAMSITLPSCFLNRCNIPCTFFLFPSAVAQIPAAEPKSGHISCILSFLCPRSLLLGTVVDEGRADLPFLPI